jgi:hypothetical protein
LTAAAVVVVLRGAGAADVAVMRGAGAADIVVIRGTWTTGVVVMRGAGEAAVVSTLKFLKFRHLTMAILVHLAHGVSPDYTCKDSCRKVMRQCRHHHKSG